MAAFAGANSDDRRPLRSFAERVMISTGPGKGQSVKIDRVDGQEVAPRHLCRLGMLVVAASLAACGQADSQSNGGQTFNIRQATATQKLMYVGYDLDIAREKKGLPVQRANKSWAEFWLVILSNLKSTKADGPAPAQNYDQYVRYIVACRHAAGLPDLPGHNSSGIYPPGGCDVTGAGAMVN